MRIIFLCGSLEPSHDGVGDYTLRLAGELCRQGHQVSAIALHDKLLRQKVVETKSDNKTEKIKSLRLSNRLTWKERITLASEFIKRENPEWISLQYVPFSFQDKGLPIGLAKGLKEIGHGRNWHIMFHELWVGMEMNSSFKMKLWGFFQRKTIQYIINSLSPKVIHTQCSLYREHLIRLGYQVKYLPLFGNIPVLNKNNLQKKGDKLVFVVFGTIHPNVPIEVFIKKLADLSEKQSKEVFVTFIGRNGPELAKWTSLLAEKHIQYKQLDEQPVDSISKVLSEADYGISSNPVILLEKSGTTVAMIEHGLPVISVSNSWKLPFEVEKPDLFKNVRLIDIDLNLIKTETKPITDIVSSTAKNIAMCFN